jgi:hypothetical protein
VKVDSGPDLTYVVLLDLDPHFLLYRVSVPPGVLSLLFPPFSRWILFPRVGLCVFID